MAVAVPNLLDRPFWIKKFMVDFRSSTCEDWLLLGLISCIYSIVDNVSDRFDD